MVVSHVWAVPVGVAAVGLPVLIHYLTRPRPVRLPISTLRFIQEAVQQRRTIHRLRDALILAMRTLAVLLMASAFVRPLIGQRPLHATSEPNTVRVVVVDVSQSLAANRRGIQAFEQARPLAAGFLSFNSSVRANLILAGARPHAIFDGPSTNFAALREALATAKPRPERIDVPAALAAAARMLTGGPAELVIVSDFQASNWADADFGVLPQGTRVQLESVAAAEKLSNLAVVRVVGAGRATRGEDIRIDVEVGNYSATPQKAQLEIAMGSAVARGEGICPPGVKTTIPLTIRPEESGWQCGWARLVGPSDALDVDDKRPFAVEVRPAASYAMITREPKSHVGTSSYYLERALVPVRVQGAGEKIELFDPTQLDPQGLANADLLLVEHPGKLSADAIRLLASLLQRGRSVLYVTSEVSDAVNLKLLVGAMGPTLKMPVEFTPSSPGASRSDLSMTDIRRDTPPFRIFGDRLTAVASSIRLCGGLPTRRLASGLPEDIWAACSDGSALLVVSGCGSGYLAVLNADLAASNLPASTLFVPMLNELVGVLMGEQRLPEQVACGEPVSLLLPVEVGPVTGLNIVPPVDADDIGGVVEDGSVRFRCGSPAGPGFYMIKRDKVLCYALASAIPSVESDLATMDPAVLRAKAGPQAQYHTVTAGVDEGRDDLWVWLAMGATLCLLGEVVLLRLFRT